MGQFGPLGIFLILSVILPGLIITSALLMLFPELGPVIGGQGGMEFIGVVILVGFINGPPAFLFERYVLDRIWNRLFADWGMKERNDLAARRSKIIADAEIRGLIHNHYDQTLGEFILFNNTGFWLVFIGGIRLSRWPHMGLGVIAVVVMLASVVSLLFVSPFFKKSYTDILKALEEEIQRGRESS